MKKKELLDFLKDGCFYEQIANQKGIQMQIVMNQVKQMDPLLIKEARTKGREVRKLKKNGCSKELIDMVKQCPSDVILPKNVTMKRIKRKIKMKTLTELELIQYRKSIEMKKSKVLEEEVTLLLEGYITMGQLRKAICFLNNLESNEEMKHINMEKMKTMKEEMLQVQKEQQARRNRNARTDSEIVDIMEMC